MSSIKIVHMADMHLGSSFASLCYNKAKIRENEAIMTALNIIKRAKDSDVLLISGDAFESGNVPFSIADALLAAIEDIAPVPVFYSCGNHDSYYTDIVRYCIDNKPSNLHIFEPYELSSVCIDEKKFIVHGVSFSAPECNKSLVSDDLICNSEYINILCIHGDLHSEKYNYIDPLRLSSLGIDYAALGHVHTYTGIKKCGNLFYAYPGISEGRGFDECMEKGYIYGTLSKDECRLDFISASKRVYLDDKIDISDFKNEYELIDVLNSMAGGTDNICRFTFVGENNHNLILDSELIRKNIHAFDSVCIDQSTSVINPDDYITQSGIRGLCAAYASKLLNETQDKTYHEKVKKAFSMIVNNLDKR